MGLLWLGNSRILVSKPYGFSVASHSLIRFSKGCIVAFMKSWFDRKFGWKVTIELWLPMLNAHIKTWQWKNKWGVFRLSAQPSDFTCMFFTGDIYIYICMFHVYIHTYLIDAVLVCLVMCEYIYIYICLIYFVLFKCQWLARFLKAVVANECLLVRTHSIFIDIHSICSSFPPPSSPSCSVGQNGFFDLDAPWMAFNGDRKWRQTRTFPQHYILPSGKHLWLIFRQALGVYVLLHPRCLFGPFWANFQFLCFTPSDLYLFLLSLLPWLRVNSIV